MNLDKKLWDSLGAKQGEFMKALPEWALVLHPKYPDGGGFCTKQFAKHYGWPEYYPAISLSMGLQVRYIEMMGYYWDYIPVGASGRTFGLSKSVHSMTGACGRFPSLLAACEWIAGQVKK